MSQEPEAAPAVDAGDAGQDEAPDELPVPVAVPATLAEIPTVKFDGWKTINTDALYFLHACLVLMEIPIGAAPVTWEQRKDTLEQEVLQFGGLEGNVTAGTAVRACFERLDKTYLLDFLSLFGIQQTNGRTYNRRHSPNSLVSALLEYLASPGKHYFEIHQLITRKERPIRARVPPQALSMSPVTGSPQSQRVSTPVHDEARVPATDSIPGVPESSHSSRSDDEEEWGQPESGSGKRARGQKRRLSLSGSKKKPLAGVAAAAASSSTGAISGGAAAGGAVTTSGGSQSRKRASADDAATTQSGAASGQSRKKTAVKDEDDDGDHDGDDDDDDDDDGSGAKVDLWVACDQCSKWRLLPPGTYASEADLPSKWTCAMNPDKRYNACDIAEEAAAKGDQSPAQQTPKPRKKKAASAAVAPVETRAPDEKPIVPVKLPFDDSDNGDVEEGDEDTTSGALARKAGALVKRVHASMSSALVPAFFRASVPVYRGRLQAESARLGKLALTERESLGDVRARVAAMMGASVAPAHVALFKRGVIPLHTTQDHKLAHHFLVSASDYLCAIDNGDGAQ